MRFTTHTDWTMVTGADCYGCKSQIYNSTLSTTSSNGTFAKTEAVVGSYKLQGESVKDTVCIAPKNTPCVENFEFFVIKQNRDLSALDYADGIMGLAPDANDNGPSYMTSLRNLSLIDKLQVSFKMTSLNGAKSTVTFGGYDKSSMLPFPDAKNPKFYWYDNKYDDKEWGTEIRNMLIGNFSLDSGVKTYAKIDTVNPNIMLPFGYMKNYISYLNDSHKEMVCD